MKSRTGQTDAACFVMKMECVVSGENNRSLKIAATHKLYTVAWPKGQRIITFGKLTFPSVNSRLRKPAGENSYLRARNAAS
jgi:hypothetical protein